MELEKGWLEINIETDTNRKQIQNRGRVNTTAIPLSRVPFKTFFEL